MTKQMELIKGRYSAILGSTLAALRVLSDHGSASTINVLNAIISSDPDPTILTEAKTALLQVLARQPVK